MPYNVYHWPSAPFYGMEKCADECYAKIIRGADEPVVFPQVRRYPEERPGG